VAVWHQLGHVQVSTSLQTDNHASTPQLSFLQAGCSFLPPNQQRQSTEGTVFPYPTISKPLLSSNGFWAISFCQILLFRIVKGHTNKKLNIFGSPVVCKVQALYDDRGPQARSCTSKTFGSDAHSFTTRGL